MTNQHSKVVIMGIHRIVGLSGKRKLVVPDMTTLGCQYDYSLGILSSNHDYRVVIMTRLW